MFWILRFFWVIFFENLIKKKLKLDPYGQFFSQYRVENIGVFEGPGVFESGGPGGLD